MRPHHLFLVGLAAACASVPEDTDSATDEPTAWTPCIEVHPRALRFEATAVVDPNQPPPTQVVTVANTCRGE